MPQNFRLPCDCGNSHTAVGNIGMVDASIRLLPVWGDLPVGFDDLREEAHTEGYRMLDRLAADWQAGMVRFDRPGERLLAAEGNGVLAAIGGLTLDPVMVEALRMRRFYVRRQFRRSGIGRCLAADLLDPPAKAGRLVTVNAAARSSPFWEALGFVREEQSGHTHVLVPRRTKSRPEVSG